MALRSNYDARRAQYTTFPDLSAVMLRILRGPVISQINLHIHHNHINATSFQKVAHLVESRQVLVRRDLTSKPGENYTLEEFDTVLIGPNGPGGQLYINSGFVHEAVHVRADMRGNYITSEETEFRAFVVQAVYLRLNNFVSNNIPSATNTTLLPAAFAVADYVIGGNQIPPALETALKSAMRAVPEYRNTNRLLLFDGVRPHH